MGKERFGEKGYVKNTSLSEEMEIIP